MEINKLLEKQIDDVCKYLITHAGHYSSPTNLLTLINDSRANIDKNDLEVVQKYLSDSGLFESVNTMSGPSISMNKWAPGLINDYGGFSFYVNRKEVSDIEVTNMVIEELKRGPIHQLSHFFMGKSILFNREKIRNVRSILTSTELVDVQTIETQGFSDGSLRLNGKGILNLRDKTYLEYEQELNSRIHRPTISIGGSVIGASVGQQGNFNQDNQNSFGNSDYVAQLERENAELKARIIKLEEQVHQLIGLLGNKP